MRRLVRAITRSALLAWRSSPRGSLVRAVAFSPISRTLATGASDGSIEPWDPVSWTC
jgi:WD40 repeat protein